MHRGEWPKYTLEEIQQTDMFKAILKFLESPEGAKYTFEEKAMHQTTVKRSWNDPDEWTAICTCGAIMTAHSEEAVERAGHNHEQNPTVYAQLDNDWSGCCV